MKVAWQIHEGFIPLSLPSPPPDSFSALLVSKTGAKAIIPLFWKPGSSTLGSALARHIPHQRRIARKPILRPAPHAVYLSNLAMSREFVPFYWTTEQRPNRMKKYAPSFKKREDFSATLPRLKSTCAAFRAVESARLL